jgi:hypothetical protein
MLRPYLKLSVYRNHQFSLSAVHSAKPVLKKITHLLKHLPIRPFTSLPLNFNRLIPAPLVLEKFLILLLAGVKLGELVALVVGGDVKRWHGFVAADEEGTSDDGVVADAVDGGSAEDVFAGGFETGEETT